MTAPSSRTGATDREVEAHSHRWSAWATGYRRQCLDCRAWSEQDEPRNDAAALLAEQPGGGDRG